MSVRQSPTAQWWQYPLASPSFRFTQINNLVRQLDLRFASLSPDDQDEWDGARRDWPWWARCVPWIFDYDPFNIDGTTAIAAYRSVNAARVVNGLNVSDTPPTPVTPPDGDILDVSSVGTLQVIWGGRSSAPAGEYCCHVRAVPLNHEPERGPALSKYRWCLTTPIEYGVSLDLSDIFTVNPGLASPPFVGLALSVMQKESAPFVGQRSGFYNPIE